MILRRTAAASLTHCRPWLDRATAAASTSIAGKEEKEEEEYLDVPRGRRRWERKPYLTPVKELIRRVRAAKKVPPAPLKPPADGRLVAELVPVAATVYSAWRGFLFLLARLLSLPAFRGAVHRCRFCDEVHVSSSGGHAIRSCEGKGSTARSGAHAWAGGGIRDLAPFPPCFHLFDRAAKPRIAHHERHLIPRVPAIVELCVQAGLDLPFLPTRRRHLPLVSLPGRLIDLEENLDLNIRHGKEEENEKEEDVRELELDVQELESLEELDVDVEELENLEGDELAERTLERWLAMREGAVKLMTSYPVHTCGFCEEVQVGPKGHKVRMCKAAGHQNRAGLHAWQEADVDDLLGKRYVWHMRGRPLENELKRFYGKAPAVVEICVLAGAAPPPQFASMMRLDVAVPALDERDLVA